MATEKVPGMWYSDDIEDAANTDKTLGIPEVSDDRLLAEEIILGIFGVAVAIFAIWKGWDIGWFDFLLWFF